jgi:uncharacterized FAD-dependent dehydrogenase
MGLVLGLCGRAAQRADVTMLRVFEIKLPLDHSQNDLLRAISDALQVSAREVLSWEIRRQAIDARKKTTIRLIYTVDVSLRHEAQLVGTVLVHRVIPTPDESYQPAKLGSEMLEHRPVVVGSGPAGLFAGLILAQAGYQPVILERGKAVDERCLDVERFWKDGILNPESNAQFGEGGAGTFSDGKLSTLINDLRCRKVLEELAMAGAPPAILVSNKPHIGTDQLRVVVRTIRELIIRLGGEVRFLNRVSGLRLRDCRLCGLEINDTGVLDCEAAVFAIGHSSRDTFNMLLKHGLTMIPKPFSVGMRIEHPQLLIDQAQYGAFAGHPRLGPADYKLAYHAPDGRSAYTFCMCPGGDVIAAASEPGGLVTNGMSLQARSGPNANSALLVNVGPADFPDDHPLAGFRFQREWEARAFRLARETYAAPVQSLADFIAGRFSKQLGHVAATYRPAVVPADLRACLPAYVCDTVKQAIPAFARRLKGFDLPDAVLTGVETRSSCPVRLVRGKDFQASISGLYPAGEGGGYAGGIMSSAVDGIKVAEAIISRFSPPQVL